MVDAILEVRRGRLDRLVWAVEKLAGRELRLADAVPERLVLAWIAFQELPALIALVERWAGLRAEAERYTPAEALSAA